MILRESGTWIWGLSNIPRSRRERLIARAALVLRRGGVVAFPTETVYGLAADGLSPSAVRKVFRAKGRPRDNPLILHLHGRGQAPELAAVDRRAWDLMGEFWPGPLTVILPATRRVPLEVRAGLPTVALRCPDHPVALDLIRESGTALAGPSANRSGRPSPTSARHVLEDLAGRVGVILDGGPSGIGVESTVVDMSSQVPTILRPGGLSREDLEGALGRVQVGRYQKGQIPPSPGMKYRHYAPRARVYLVRGGHEQVIRAMMRLSEQLERRGLSVGYLVCGEGDSSLLPGPVISLGKREAPEQAASRLYRALRDFDRLAVDVVLAEEVEATGLGMAVSDRLARAALMQIEADEVMDMSPEPPKSVLMVCSGNTCRSPMAEALLKDLLPGAKVMSAGVAAREGAPASGETRVLLAQRDLDPEDHRAQRVNRDLVQGADLVLVMTRAHLDLLRREFPQFSSRIRLLAQEAGCGQQDIIDPFGGGREIYEETLDQLEKVLRALVRRWSWGPGDEAL